MLASLVVLWHTTVRSRFHGIRADYCPGCLCITKHGVRGIEKAHHVLHVSLGYREVARLCECPLCGTPRAISPDMLMLGSDGASDKTIEELIEATNPDLTPQRVRELQSPAEWASAELREAHVLQQFCVNQMAEFDAAARNLSGWSPLIVMLSLAVAVCVMTYAGFLAGLPAGVGLFGFALLVRRKMIDAAAARKILPRLRLFLRAVGRDIAYLQGWLKQRSDRRYRRLSRHLETSRYESFRQIAAGLDAEPSATFSEFIVAEDWGV